MFGRVAGLPGRRVAGSPGDYMICFSDGSLGRRVARSPGDSMTSLAGRRVAGLPGRRLIQ